MVSNTSITSLRSSAAARLRARGQRAGYAPHAVRCCLQPARRHDGDAVDARHRRRHRVGYAHYQYGRLHNHLAPSSALLWGRTKTHSVEQQLALLGWTGVPVSDRPPTHLAATEGAAATISAKLGAAGLAESASFAVVHPAAAFDTKRWATENFARVVEDLAARGAGDRGYHCSERSGNRR